MARAGEQGGDSDNQGRWHGLITHKEHHKHARNQTKGTPGTRGDSSGTSNIKKKVKIETYNYLLVWGDELQGLLDDPAAVHLQGQRQHVPTDALCQRQLLLQAAKL